MNANKRQEAGTRFGSYEIVRSLGLGGMASVYEARHTALGKRVAIKVLHPHLSSNPVAAARFVREGRAASAVRHPNVVEVFEIGIQSGTPYLVMELLEGGDLATHLHARGRLSVSVALDILLPTASAVAAAHAVGVIHRDLKPRNIFLAYERRTGLRPKVVDFGISKVSHDGDDRALTATESLLGTLDYMAPEQARSAKNATERSDQYALGVILYECLTGRKPFSGSSTYELLHAVVTAPFATPRALGVDIDSALEAVILRAMSRDPRERFSSVDSFGRALLPFASQMARALWQEDFERSESPRSDADPAVAALSPTGASTAAQAATESSLIGATLPETGAAARRDRPRARRAFPAILVAALGVVALLAPSAFRAMVNTQPPAAEAVTVREPVSKPAPEEVASVPGPVAPVESPSLPPPIVPSPAAPSKHAAQPQPARRAPERAWRTAAALSATAPSSAAPSSAPSSVVVAQPERGFNGAPIVE
jgi:serine/threonine protein kinase